MKPPNNSHSQTSKQRDVEGARSPDAWDLSVARPILSVYDLKLPDQQRALLTQFVSILSTAALKIARKDLRRKKAPNFDEKP